jgi:hypothetical protein
MGSGGSAPERTTYYWVKEDKGGRWTDDFFRRRRWRLRLRNMTIRFHGASSQNVWHNCSVRLNKVDDFEWIPFEKQVFRACVFPSRDVNQYIYCSDTFDGVAIRVHMRKTIIDVQVEYNGISHRTVVEFGRNGYELETGDQGCA